MKKLISIISAIAVVMSLSVPFARANAENMKVVLESVKERVDVPQELSKFESSENTYEYTSQYNFEWHTENYEKSIHVSCCDDGIITSYYKYEGYKESTPRMSKMSADEAKKIAEDFVGKINPDYPYEVVVKDNNGASVYNSQRVFPIEIYVSGVYLQNGNGNVTVDTEKGEVTDFNIWYEPDTKEYFTGEEQFIAKDKAQAAYTENFPMQLVYRSYYSDEGKEIFYPVYVTSDKYNEYINAVTGEKETIDFYKTYRTAGAGDFGVNEDAAESKAALTPQELEEIENISGLIDKNVLTEQIKANKGLGIPSGAMLDNTHLYKDYNGNSYLYHFTLRYEDDTMSVTADAKTGEIKSYMRWGKVGTERSYGNDEAFKAIAGSKADEYRFDENAHMYYRYVNGIKVEGDTACIVYDGITLTQYSINYSYVEFPSIDGVISAQDAANKMFEQTEYKPVCIAGYNGDNESCLYPVYNLEELSINPFTGKSVDWQNKEIIDVENAEFNYSDISGHYAEKYINALAEYGIGFEGGAFKPDEKITQSDLLTLLGTIYGGGDVIVFLDNKVQADNAYSRAVSHNIIKEDERDDNAVLTRETASIYLIRAMGAEEYAKYNDIYVTPFDDVTENKGYIALLSAMGVVHGDGGHFNPEREITRAEFAVMLYNYLNR